MRDRSSRPLSSSRRTSPQLEQQVVQLRRQTRRGQDWIGPELGVPARTVSRILRRQQLPYLRDCDPLTGQIIRASKTTAVRYERDQPGELVHMNVKKIGRIPDGGGWRAHGRGAASIARDRSTKVGFDYAYSVVDDHSRLAYSEVLTDEKGATCAGFLARAAAYFASYGIIRIERVMTDNAWAYKWSLRAIINQLGARQVFIKPLPVAERQSRATQPDPAERVGLQTGLPQQHRTPGSACSVDRVLQHSTPPQRTRRTPTDEPTATNLMARYT
ncbi:DDE-type integrase/transposase/recombinase [Pseudonocardia xinjiangensis]|uniref:DDE-type integrase/transposase/recombinase n=1 Tax=Pseudonocardia xinjiangensis TaxID=75289 RepID=UPI003D8D11C1